MGRRFIIGVIVVVVFVSAGAAFALLTRDGDTADTAGGTTTTTAATSSTAPSNSSTTTRATTTTVSPTTTTVVPGLCGAVGAVIQASVNNGVDGARDRAQIDECRLAAADTSWAVVRLVAKPRANFANTTVLLHSAGGAWAVVATGGDDAGCSKAPQQVLVDLGIVCSSGGGGGP
jgi:hypothetical protein